MSTIPQLIESVSIEKVLANNVTKFESILPKNLTPQKLFRLTITEVRKNPDLGKCTVASLISSLLSCAQVGLEIGTNKAYLVPYNKNVNIGTKGKPQWIQYKECQFQIGYRGLIELALRTGKVLKIYAQNVFSNDKFICNYGSEEKLLHIPTIVGDRGDFLGAYAVAKLDSGEYQVDFMTAAEINVIRDRVLDKIKSDKTPWKTDYYEMCRKTVTKRLCKYLPSSSELDEAIKIDDESELEIDGNIYDAEPQKEVSKTERLKRNMETQKAIDTQNKMQPDTVNDEASLSEQLDNFTPSESTSEMDKSWRDFQENK